VSEQDHARSNPKQPVQAPSVKQEARLDQALMADELLAMRRALQAAEAQVRLIGDFTHNWEYWLDADGGYRYVSPACQRVTGFSPLEFQQDPGLFLRIVHPDDRSLVEKHLNEDHRQAHMHELTFRVVTRSSEVRWIRHACQPVYASDGSWLGWRGSNVDITDHILSEQALSDERDFTSAILNTAGALVIVLDRDGHIVRFNQACERITGYLFEEVQGQCFWDIFLLEDEIGPVKRVFDRLRSGDFPNQYENAWITKDGRTRQIQWTNTAIYDKRGQVQYIIGTGLDVTEQRQVEQERERLLHRARRDREAIQQLAARLAQERDVLQTIMENTHACLAYLDTDFRFLTVNSTYAEQSGHTPEELVGSLHFDLFPNEENQAIFEQVRDTGRPVAFHARPFEYADQPERGVTYWDWSLVPVKDSAGQVKGLVFSLLDVTQEVRAGQEREQLLADNRAQREFLERLLESAPIGVAIVGGPEHRYEMVNSYYQAIAGPSTAPMVGRTLAQVFPEIAAGGATKLVNSVYRTGRIASVRQYPASVSPGRETTYWDVDHVPLLAADGSVERVLILAREVTDQVEAQNTLHQQNQDLKALSQELDAYAHTVAHDLKQPLTAIVGLTDLLQEALAGQVDERTERIVGMVGDTACKMSDIVQGLLLLASARQHEVVQRPLDMAAVVEAARMRLARDLDAYDCDLIVPDAWPRAMGYAPWVESVWTNYISNALKYGGRPARVELGAAEEDAGMVRFWVRDNGTGLTAEEQGRLFSPFSQLERSSQVGHGLGLAIVRRIVGKLGGQVGVDSQPGEGSTFWFTLPACDDRCQ
jgi:PAS domain S-box-containing protein